MTIDPLKRPTAENLLEHPYFNGMFEELPHELKVPEEFTPENSSAESSPEKGLLHIEAPAPTDLNQPLAILEEAKRVEETTSEEGCEHERPGN